jgi:hypothetical protein
MEDRITFFDLHLLIVPMNEPIHWELGRVELDSGPLAFPRKGSGHSYSEGWPGKHLHKSGSKLAAGNWRDRVNSIRNLGVNWSTGLDPFEVSWTMPRLPIVNVAAKRIDGFRAANEVSPEW